MSHKSRSYPCNVQRGTVEPFIEVGNNTRQRSRAMLQPPPPINHILFLRLSPCRGLDPIQSLLIESVKQIKWGFN